MGEFFKVFLRGIITILLLPFVLAFLALYTVYCVFVYLIMLVRNVVVFFMGGSINKMKQDTEAIKLLENKSNTEKNMSEMLAGIMHSAIQQNPEAVQAMAQQQIAANNMANSSQTPSVDEIPEITPTTAPSDGAENIIFEEGAKND